jgi:thiol-disulfide isomerase/thioredoxin
MPRRWILFVLMLAAFRASGAESGSPPVSPSDWIGRPPPPLQVARWIKGEPFTRFGEGRVVVVDLWATWCGPCKAAIPHLTRLVADHPGRVEVLGISISEQQKNPEDTAYLERVRQFVEKQGDRMNYRVAADTPDRRMHSTWFKPAGTAGIPTAWIIDGRGQVAWIGIGDPPVVTRIVEELLAGTFDARREMERQRREEQESKARAVADAAAARARDPGGKDKFPGYRAAMERGDKTAALAALDAAFATDATLEPSGPYQWKLMLLLQRNKPPEVNDYARELMRKYPDNDDVVGFVSAVIVATSEDEPRFDPVLALDSARKAAAFAKPDSRWQQFTRWRLGWALYHQGKKEEALAQMRLAREGVRTLKVRHDFGTLGEECDEALRLFAK